MPEEHIDDPVFIWLHEEDVNGNGTYQVESLLAPIDNLEVSEDNPYVIELVAN